MHYNISVTNYEIQYRDVGAAESGADMMMRGPSPLPPGGSAIPAAGGYTYTYTYTYDTYEQAMPPPPPSYPPWQTLLTDGDPSGTLQGLVPSTRYEVRVRAGNGAGWSDWSASEILETSGLPEGGACLQDDAPCSMDHPETFRDVSYTYNGLGCQAAPTVTVLGGNCLVYDNGTTVGGGRRLQSVSEQGSGEFGSGSGEYGSGSGEYGSGSGDTASVEANTQCEANCSSCGANAVVEAVEVDGLVVKLNVLSGGSDYWSPPTISFSGGNCSLLPQAYAEVSDGAVSAVRLHTPCISPGGSPQGRMKLSQNGQSFASQRTQVKYEDWATCGWRIKPSVVPTGYKLRLSFDYVNTEPCCDKAFVFDGDAGADYVHLRPWDLEYGTVPHWLKSSVTPLTVASGNKLPEARISERETALLVWKTDSSVTRKGGFVLRYELQELEPPSRPAAVVVDLNMVTRYGSYVRWVAPSSPVPILWYRLQWLPTGSAESVVAAEEVLSSTHLGSPLQDLQPGVSYDVRLQAWTQAVDVARCTNGESSLCSEWSPVANFTTRTLATLWHVSPSGSYLYGDGSVSAPFPMDVQGVIEDSRVLNGAEIVLAAGTYSMGAMRGPGSAVDLNLRGKVLTIRSESGNPDDTIFDCGGTRRLLTFNNSEPPSVELRGITIRNCGGDADGRGALWITGGASPRIVNCTFVDNKAERGAAFVADAGASPTFHGCAFRGNNATSGCPCTLAKRSDSTCDEECNSRACGFDYAGSCCPASCQEGFQDEFCVGACNIPACGYDGGDCCPTTSCTTSRGDGVCDEACNNAACGFDGGDCDVDAGLMWGGYNLAEQVGSDGMGKGGVGVIASGAHVVLTECSFSSNKAELGGAFYVQGCRADRSKTRRATRPSPPLRAASPSTAPPPTAIRPTSTVDWSMRPCRRW